MSNDNCLPFVPPAPNGIITLSTDFGSSDCYAGALKGVLLSIDPDCRPIDLSHAIAAQDIEAGSFYLEQACPFFPSGTVHLAVVDPGVGTDRRLIIVLTEKHYFVGPDNGLFTGVMQSAPAYACIELTNTEYFLSNISTTFHGRDIFAPVAAHLSRGISVLAMGCPVDNPVMLSIPCRTIGYDGCLAGAVVHIDHYGNLITNVDADSVMKMVEKGGILITCSGITIKRLYSNYAQAAGRELFGIIGSSGMLEISIRGKSAQQALEAQRGQSVTVRSAPGLR